MRRRRNTKLLNESAAYRASRFMMGGGLALQAIRDPYDDMNKDYDEEGYAITNPDLQSVYSGVMDADHIAGRKHRGDMENVRDVGPRMKPSILEALNSIQENPGLYTQTPREEAAVTIFLQQTLDIIETLGESTMRITNRRLQRIIREEYSRIKKNGLLNEFGPVPDMELYEGEGFAAYPWRNFDEGAWGSTKFNTPEEEMAACMDVLGSSTGEYMLRKLFGYSKIAKQCARSIDSSGFTDGGDACIEALQMIFPAHKHMAEKVAMAWERKNCF